MRLHFDTAPEAARGPVSVAAGGHDQLRRRGLAAARCWPPAPSSRRSSSASRSRPTARLPSRSRSSGPETTCRRSSIARPSSQVASSRSNLSSFALTSALLARHWLRAGLGAAGALLGQSDRRRGHARGGRRDCRAPARPDVASTVDRHLRCASVSRSSRTRWRSGPCGSPTGWLLGLLLALPTTQRAGGDRCLLGRLPAWQRRDDRVGLVQRGVDALPLSSRRHRPRTEDLPQRHDHHDSPGSSGLRSGLSAFAPEIIAVIANPGYAVAAQVLPVVAFGAACQSVYTMLVGVIFLRRRTKQLPLITLVSAVASIALNVPADPGLRRHGCGRHDSARRISSRRRCTYAVRPPHLPARTGSMAPCTGRRPLRGRGARRARA